MNMDPTEALATLHCIKGALQVWLFVGNTAGAKKQTLIITADSLEGMRAAIWNTAQPYIKQQIGIVDDKASFAQAETPSHKAAEIYWSLKVSIGGHKYTDITLARNLLVFFRARTIPLSRWVHPWSSNLSSSDIYKTTLKTLLKSGEKN